jgi:hypothetical protein
MLLWWGPSYFPWRLQFNWHHTTHPMGLLSFLPMLDRPQLERTLLLVIREANALDAVLVVEYLFGHFVSEPPSDRTSSPQQFATRNKNNKSPTPNKNHLTPTSCCAPTNWQGHSPMICVPTNIHQNRRSLMNNYHCHHSLYCGPKRTRWAPQLQQTILENPRMSPLRKEGWLPPKLHRWTMMTEVWWWSRGKGNQQCFQWRLYIASGGKSGRWQRW